MILKDRKNTFVPNVKSVSLSYMRANPDYFGEALVLCEQFGICDIISFNIAFDADLLAQFFATVYFLKRADRTLTWMCRDEAVSCKWEVFMEALGVPVSTPDMALGLRPHTMEKARDKSELAPLQNTFLYTDAKGQKKSRLVLIPFLDIMHRIFRTSLFPRVGNLDQVHSYLVNMLLLCEEYKNTTQTLDVCSIMW